MNVVGGCSDCDGFIVVGIKELVEGKNINYLQFRVWGRSDIFTLCKNIHYNLHGTSSGKYHGWCCCADLQ